MTATAQTTRAGGILYPDGKAQEQISHRLRKAALLGGIVAAAGLQPGDVTLYRKAAEAVAGLLDVDVVEVLVDAWRAEGSLLEAARATAAEPGRTDHVRLATQTVSWSRRPSVDLYVDGTLHGSIGVELGLELEIAALEAVVRGGSLVRLESGRSTVTARLAVEGQELARQPVQLDLAAALPLGSGIPLAVPPEVARVDR